MTPGDGLSGRGQRARVVPLSRRGEKTEREKPITRFRSVPKGTLDTARSWIVQFEWSLIFQG